MNLYEELKVSAQSDRWADTLLSAVHRTLDHFHIEEDREKVANGLLKFHFVRSSLNLSQDDPKTVQLIAIDEHLTKELSKAFRLAAS